MAAARRATPRKRSMVSDQKTPVVFIVDDDESVRVAVSSLVRSVGLKAFAFASAEDFLQARASARSACLVSDVQMPGMNGLELQKTLTAQNRSLPTIFITAFPEAAVRARAEQGGAVAFLSKPFDADRLIHHIDAALLTASAP